MILPFQGGATLEFRQVPRAWRPPLESATRAPLGAALPLSREACRADLSSSRFYFQRRTPASRIATSHAPVRKSARENLGSRRGSRFGALSPDARRLFTGRAVVRAAPLISRRPSSTDFSRRRSRTKTASTEPPVTVRLDFHDPGYLSSRSHDGLRRLVTRALETQLTFRADPGVLSFGPGQYPRP